MRTRRYIISGQLYELCLRVREGLPFTAHSVTTALIKSALARAQRDSKVTLCHLVWMGNHVHLILIAHDAQQLTNFYGELQKKITDYYKRLFGLSYLNLWEGQPSVALIADYAKAIDRIVYLYSNPSRASLVNSIAEYPALNSWQACTDSSADTHAHSIEEVPWFRAPTVPKLPAQVLSKKQDLKLVARITNLARHAHKLIIKPNAWLKVFGFTEGAQVAKANEDIQARVLINEEHYRKERQALGRGVIGVERLFRQEFMQPHTPKPRSRRIFILATLTEVRIRFIQEVRTIINRCTELYYRMKQGYHVVWPPGVFPPPCPPLANRIA